MDEHFRIAHAFGANEERRQYISACCVDNGSSCGVAFKLSNRFFDALAGARFFFGFRPRLLGIGKQWVGVETAIEALALVYESKFIFDHIRSEMSFPYEWKDMPDSYGTEEQRNARGPFYAVLMRIQANGHLEKLLPLAIADSSGVNVNESERERSGIIRGQFYGVWRGGAIFRGALK